MEASKTLPMGAHSNGQDEHVEGLPDEVEIPELLAFKLRALHAELQLVELQSSLQIRTSTDLWQAGIEELRKNLAPDFPLDQYQVLLQAHKLKRKDG